MIDDTVDRAFASDLAAAMDAGAATFGPRATADQPALELSSLCAVRADPVKRADWARRSGIAAAYRDETGWSSETDRSQGLALNRRSRPLAGAAAKAPRSPK